MSWPTPKTDQLISRTSTSVLGQTRTLYVWIARLTFLGMFTALLGGAWAGWDRPAIAIVLAAFGIWVFAEKVIDRLNRELEQRERPDDG